MSDLSEHTNEKLLTALLQLIAECHRNGDIRVVTNEGGVVMLELHKFVVAQLAADGNPRLLDSGQGGVVG